MQVPKQSMRDRFVDAAEKLFLSEGFASSTMSMIASEARSSVGNLYKYFASKQALLEAIVPEALVRQLHSLTIERLRAFGAARDISEHAPDSPYRDLASMLVGLCVSHRAAVVILLRHPKDTPYESFRQDLLAQMVAGAQGYFQNAYPERTLQAGRTFALAQAYESLVCSLASACASFEEPETLRDALDALTAYHLGGLQHLFASAPYAELAP